MNDSDFDYFDSFKELVIQKYTYLIKKAILFMLRGWGIRNFTIKLCTLFMDGDFLFQHIAKM